MIPDLLLKHPESILVIRLLHLKAKLLIILHSELEDDEVDYEFCEDIYDDLNKISNSLHKARKYFESL